MKFNSYRFFESNTFLKGIFAFILIFIGLYSKVYSGPGGAFADRYFGGIIYVVFFIVMSSLIFPRARPIIISLIIFFITGLIELTQLIQTDFLNYLRMNFFIRALIGNKFNPFDYIFYVAGAIAGWKVLVIFDKKKIVQKPENE